MKVEGPMPRGVGSFSISFQEVQGVAKTSEAQEGEEQGKKPSAFLDLRKLKEFGEVLKSLFEVFNLELRFTIHEPTREIIARIVNRETGEVIREIPPEKFLDMVAKLQELAGILVDEVV